MLFAAPLVVGRVEDAGGLRLDLTLDRQGVAADPVCGEWSRRNAVSASQKPVPAGSVVGYSQ
jgi:hypothetical protein